MRISITCKMSNLRARNTIWAILIACRPRQWTKNLLAFAVPICALSFSAEIWLKAAGAFLIFCAVSSAVYLFNDVCDAEADRHHPNKCHRPIAAGILSPRLATWTAATILIIALAMATLINSRLGIVTLAYSAIQILYCLRLKMMPLLDISCIAAGFLLRAVAGGIGAGQFISPWFILTVGLLALFLAVEKRKAEMRICQERGVITRKSLERYSLPLLMRLESQIAPCTFMSYAIWASGPAVRGAVTSWMLFSVPFVLIGIFRYQLLSDPDDAIRRAAVGNTISTERPEEVVLRDRGIQLIMAGWIATVVSVNLFHRWLG